MRTVRYSVAASLDGYIAGPNGEFDWIPEDPTVDFGALFAGVDTVLLGRRSYELIAKAGASPWKPDTRVYVFSRTLEPSDHLQVTLVGNDAERVVADLRAEDGEGEIWLFGGGVLFRSLVLAGQVDRVEVTVVPILVLCSQSLFRFADLGDDGLCRGGPDKGCGVIVSAIDVVVDRLD